MIAEPDVSLTDYGIALECAAFTWLLLKKSRQSSLAGWFTLFFSSLGLGAVFGGTVHGFFNDPSSLRYRIFWPASLISIGMVTLATWGMASTIYFSSGTARWVSQGAAFVFMLYVGIILFIRQHFWIAICDYLPASLFLLGVWITVYRRTKAKPVLTGIYGLILTLLAAGVQLGKVAIHPLYFNHNAFYHLIQAAALFMVFLSARWFTSEWKESH